MEYCTLRGEQPAPAHFDASAMTKWMACLTKLEQLKEEKGDDNGPPPELKMLSNWATWEEQFVTYLGCTWNAIASTPLSYIVREHTEVDDAHHTMNYPLIDADLVDTSLLHGESFTLDNHRVFNLLKPLLVGGPGCPFIQPLNWVKDE